MGGVLTDLVRWVIEVVHSLEYVGVFVLILAGSLYLPVPTELTLPLFGFLIGNGRLSFVPVLLAATAARVCCARPVLRRIQAQGGALAACDRALRAFEAAVRIRLRNGECGIRASRGKSDPGRTLDPGRRRLVSVPAGLKRMPVRGRFLGYTILGCSIWNASLIGLGWALGGRWRIVEVFTSFVGAAVLIVVISATIWFFWRRRKVHE